MKETLKNTHGQLKKGRNLGFLVLFVVLISSLTLTISAVIQRQQLRQYAQNTVSSPPLYGCLHTGEADKTLCGSKLGVSSWSQELMLNGRILKDQQEVYYGDRLKGSLSFSNVGDLPIQIEKMGISAYSVPKNFRVDFFPINGYEDLQPQQNISVDNASHVFDGPEPNGLWKVSPKILNTDGQSLMTDSTKKSITINATCTALRAKELTETDKTNLQKYCGQNKDSKLCNSRQYCEIFKGEGCTQPNASEETPGWQCDPYVYMPKSEQDLLEEFCKVYPDSDTCTDFCDRSVGASICPDKYLFVDTRTGKAIPFHNQHALYVRNPDAFKFTYAEKYPKDKVKMGAPKTANANAITAVAGIKIALGAPGMGGPMKLAPVLPPAAAPVVAAPAPALPSGPAAPATTAPAPPPPPCGVPGAAIATCPPEKNSLPPDPKVGRMVDTTTCTQNPDGTTTEKVAGGCKTSVTDPTKAQAGDFGYNASCGSGRQDMNPTDDPAGAQQAACCASSLTLREGCCSQICTVWSQKVLPGGGVELRDGNNNVCSNNRLASLADNTCGRSRADTVPINLGGTGGAGGPNPDVNPGPVNRDPSICYEDFQCPSKKCNGHTSAGPGKCAPVDPKADCPVGEKRDISGICVGDVPADCQPPKIFYNGTCNDTSCGTNQHIEQAVCVDNGQKLDTNQCVGGHFENGVCKPGAGDNTSGGKPADTDPKKTCLDGNEKLRQDNLNCMSDCQKFGANPSCRTLCKDQFDPSKAKDCSQMHTFSTDGCPNGQAKNTRNECKSLTCLNNNDQVSADLNSCRTNCNKTGTTDSTCINKCESQFTPKYDSSCN